MVAYARTTLLLFVSKILIVSGITLEEAKYQLEKNADRREFMMRMSAATEMDFEHEILTGTETVRFNEELISKVRPRMTGKSVPSSRRMEDGAAADDDEEWYEEEAQYYNWNGLGVNIADYSLKFHKCTTMKSFAGQEAEQEYGTPFTENKFVTFRLCPTDSCVADGWDGCRESYGEYMMDMDEFVESQARYDEEVFEQYCNYCQTCMYFENYFYGNMRRLNDNQHACKYYDDCYNYENVCEDDGNEGKLTLEQLHECIPIEDAVQRDDYYDDDGNANADDGTQYYLGIACRNTLHMALFSDEDCSQFVSTGDEIFNVTGYDVSLDDDVMGPFLSHQCVSCRESELPYLISYADDEDEDDILELCEEIYLASARCDERLWEVEYETAVDQYYAERTCEFIENVIKGNVNQYGLSTVNESETSDFFHKWVPQKYWPEEDIVISQDEVAYLTMGILGCMVMLIYISYFKKQLAKYPEPLLQTNLYNSNSQQLSSATSTYQSFETNATKSGALSKSEDSKDTNYDPVAAARSID